MWCSAQHSVSIVAFLLLLLGDLHGDDDDDDDLDDDEVDDDIDDDSF